MKMTTEEAFVKVLQMHGIEHAFGIIGSAMMPISDLFPQAGITFWDAAHECNAGMMADGFTRSTGKMSLSRGISAAPKASGTQVRSCAPSKAMEANCSSRSAGVIS